MIKTRMVVLWRGWDCEIARLREKGDVTVFLLRVGPVGMGVYDDRLVQVFCAMDSHAKDAWCVACLRGPDGRACCSLELA